MRDSPLTAVPVTTNPGELPFPDSVSFTVLYVYVTVNFSGTASADDDRHDVYKNMTDNKTYDLGLQPMTTPAGQKTLSHAFEVRGVVSPSTFDYPKADLHFTRDRQSQVFNGNTPVPGQDNAIPYSNTIIGNDLSDRTIRDDDPAPNDNIYDIDAAGLVRSVDPLNTIHRYRFNFREWAIVAIDRRWVRASNIFEGCVVQSLRQIDAPNGSNWVELTPPGQGAVMGDNTAGPGQTKLSWDLQ